MFMTDLWHALRRLRSQTGTTIAAVAMLGLGIGIATAMYTVVDALVLRPVPFARPNELASVYMGDQHGGANTVAPAVLHAWRESKAFVQAESVHSDTIALDVDGAIATQRLAWVTPGLFSMLGGVQPVLGRLFDQTEGRAGSDDRVLISEPLWRASFGADRAVIGRHVNIDGEPVVIIGVLPSQFHFPMRDTVMWRPIDFDALASLRAKVRPTAYVRFATDIPRADALRLATMAARTADATTERLQARTRPLLVQESYTFQAMPLLGGGVIFMFLTLCINVSSLLLARTTVRRREFSTYAALGASPARLIRQAFIESGVLGLLGVVVGVALGSWLVTLVRSVASESYLMQSLNPLSLNTPALSIAVLAGLVAMCMAGLLPAWLASRADAIHAMRAADHGASETRRARALTNLLLISQIALACMLLIAATLLVRSFINLSGTARGFDASRLSIATMSLPTDAFPDRSARAAVAKVIEERLRQVPGVQGVAWSYGVPPDGASVSTGRWTSDAANTPAKEMTIDRYNVGPDFFALYGISLLSGRTFQPGDADGDVVISERLARALWPDVNPNGRTFRFENEQLHVIGVAREIQYPSLDASLDRPELYARFGGVGRYAMLTLGCTGVCPEPGVVRRQLTGAHPAIKVLSVRRLDDVYREQLVRPRAVAALAVLFAAIAVATAAAGLFCVLTLAVGRRRREFGIRLALGASPEAVRRVVMRDGLRICAIGLVIGSVGAFAVTRALASLQYGVTIRDPLTWVMVLGAIAIVCLAASWRPARDAMRVAPALLLKEE
jgi:putative ABC transport system permease protein